MDAGTITASVIKVSTGSNNSRFTSVERSELPPSKANKAEWRAWAKTQRISDRDETSSVIADHLAAWLPGGSTVLSFLPMLDEVDLGELEQIHLELVMTRTPDAGWLTVHAWDAPRETHQWGFEHPAPEAVVFTGAIDIALVPGVLFDNVGRRLGHGKGYYDELLARLEVPVRIGVAPGALMVPILPAQDHDVRMTHLVSEQGVREVIGSEPQSKEPDGR